MTAEATMQLADGGIVVDWFGTHITSHELDWEIAETERLYGSRVCEIEIAAKD